MTHKYRYRFPILILVFKWGMTIAWQPPVMKIERDSISTFMGMFDE